MNNLEEIIKIIIPILYKSLDELLDISQDKLTKKQMMEYSKLLPTGYKHSLVKNK